MDPIPNLLSPTIPSDGYSPQSIVAGNGYISIVSLFKSVVSDNAHRWALLTLYRSRQCISVDTRTTYSAQHSKISMVWQQQYLTYGDDISKRNESMVILTPCDTRQWMVYRDHVFSVTVGQPIKQEARAFRKIRKSHPGQWTIIIVQVSINSFLLQSTVYCGP